MRGGPCRFYNVDLFFFFLKQLVALCERAAGGLFGSSSPGGSVAIINGIPAGGEEFGSPTSRGSRALRQGTRVSAATMNPPCGRCNKPVYPTEKINCLDKVRQVIHTRSDLCKAPGRFLEVCFIKALDFGCITLSMSRLRPGGHAHFVAKHPDRHRRGVLGLPKPGKSSWFLQN